MDAFDERRSTFVSSASPGALAAHRRLSGLSTAASTAPPTTEKPYLAGRVASSAVNSRLSQKAELLQYLSGHGGTVNRMLGTLPEQPCTSDLGTSPAAITVLPATAPAACMSSSPQLEGAFYNPSFSRHSNMSMTTSSLRQTAGSKASTNTAASRSSTVSAYLHGHQDLLTTIGGADARVLAGVTSPLPYGEDNTSQDNRLQDDVSMRCRNTNTASSAACTAGASSGSSSRHSVVKDALAARMSAFTGARGSVSPRYHEASLSVREALLTEGRARRSLATVMHPVPPSGSAAAAACGGADHAMGLRYQHVSQRSRSSQFYPVESEKCDHFLGRAMSASWQQRQFGEVAGWDSRGSTSPLGMSVEQHANDDNTATEAATSATWMIAGCAEDALATVPGQVYKKDFSRSESSDDSTGAGSAPGARRDSHSSSDSSSGPDAAVLDSKVRGWRQRLSNVKAARRSLVKPSGRQPSSSTFMTFTRPQGRRYSAAGGAGVTPQGRRYSGAGAGASAGATRETASFKQRGVRRSALNRWSSSHSNPGGRSQRRDSSSSSDASCMRQTNSSSDGQKPAPKVRSSMHQQRLSANPQQRQAGTSCWPSDSTQERLGRQRVPQSSRLPAGATRRSVASAARRYTTSTRRYSKSHASTDSSSSSGSSSSSSTGHVGSLAKDEWVPVPAVRKVSQGERDVFGGTGRTRPSRRSTGPGKCRVLVRSQPCSAEVKLQRRQLAVSLLQKVGRQLKGQSLSRSSSSNGEEGQSLGRSVSGRSSVRRGSVARSRAAVSMTALRRSSSSSSGGSSGNHSDSNKSSFSSSRSMARFSRSNSRSRGRYQQGFNMAAGRHRPGQPQEAAALGDISATTAARRSLSGALECMLNPADKPSHRMSLTATDAAAVVLGRSSRTHPRNSCSFKLGAPNSRRVSSARVCSVNLNALRRTSSYGSSGAALGNAGGYAKQTRLAPRLSNADSAVGARRPSAFLRACLRSEHTAALRRSGAAPGIMVRPGRKSWAQVYEEAVGVVPLV